MPRVSMALGSILFRDFEIPPQINFGGRQRMAVHHLADGRRITDCLGPDDADIAFSGVFGGEDATLRARAVDDMRCNGTVLPLTWGTFFFPVIVRDFRAEFQNETWIPYSIRCVVVQDEADNLLEASVPLSQLLRNDIVAAAASAVASNLDFNALSSVVATSGATTFGTTEFISAQAALASAHSALNEQLKVSEATLSSIGLVDVSAGSALTGLVSATARAEQIAGLTRARAYLGRAAANLGTQGAST